MDRAQKQQLTVRLHQDLAETVCVVVTHQTVLSVAEVTQLRQQMRSAGARYRVTKNRLVKRALEGTQFADLAPLFSGPTAIAFSQDPVAAAKAAVAYANRNAKLTIVGGGLAGQMLDEAAVKALATLPSLDELRSKIIGLLNAPATKLAVLLQTPAGSWRASWRPIRNKAATQKQDQATRARRSSRRRRNRVAAEPLVQNKPYRAQSGVATHGGSDQARRRSVVADSDRGGGAGENARGEVGRVGRGPVAVAAAGGGAAAAAEAPAEKTEFDVILAAIGEKKVNVIKEVRAVTSLV